MQNPRDYQSVTLAPLLLMANPTFAYMHNVQILKHRKISRQMLPSFGNKPVKITVTGM